MMKKKSVILLLVFVAVLAGTAAYADYGYTNLAMIPEAVDFSYSVSLSTGGGFVVTTDYPFGSYDIEAFSVEYYYPDDPYNTAFTVSKYPQTGETEVIWNTFSYAASASEEEIIISAYQSIQNHEVAAKYIRLDRTAGGSITYAVDENRYISYSESSFDASVHAGYSASVNYTEDGDIYYTYIFAYRFDSGYINMNSAGLGFDKYGNFWFGSATVDGVSYEYQSDTGLFDGMTLSDLGFDESEIYSHIPAAVGLSQPPVPPVNAAASLTGAKDITVNVNETVVFKKSDFAPYPANSLIGGKVPYANTDFWLYGYNYIFGGNSEFNTQETDDDVIISITPTVPGYYILYAQSYYYDETKNQEYIISSDPMLLTVRDEYGREPQIKDLDIRLEWPMTAVVGDSFTPDFWWWNAVEPVSWRMEVEHNGQTRELNYDDRTVVFEEEGEYIFRCTATDAFGRTAAASATATVSEPSPLAAESFTVDRITDHGENDYDIILNLMYSGGRHIASIHYQIFARDAYGDWNMTWEEDSKIVSPHFWIGEDGDHYFKAQITDGVTTVEIVSDIITLGTQPRVSMLTLPASLTVIDEEAFANDPEIRMVSVPASARRIEARAFAGCTALRKIFIPSGVEYIDGSAFEGVTDLKIVTDSENSAAAAFAASNGYVLVIDSGM